MNQTQIKSVNSKSTKQKDQIASMPLFYNNPNPLNPRVHGKLGVISDSNFAFAKVANAVPLTITEFSLAARHYPIVFAGAPDPMPHAILRLRSGENLFVDENGHWADGVYVPAYVRRYPFIFFGPDDNDNYTLCIDDTAEMVGEGKGAALFDGDNPTDTAKGALEFCNNFQGHFTSTVEFSTVVAQSGILGEHSAAIELNSGEKMTLGPFLTVNEDHLRKLTDETFLKWRDKGWLAPIYLHLSTLHNWSRLVDKNN